MSKPIYIMVRVSPELKERLQRQAITEHTYENPSSMSDIVIRAVEDYLRTHTAN